MCVYPVTKCTTICNFYNGPLSRMCQKHGKKEGSWIIFILITLEGQVASIYICVHLYLTF